MKTKGLILFLISGCLVLGACAAQPDYGKESDVTEAMLHCNQLYKDRQFDKANKCYEVLRTRFGGSAAASEAELRMADIFFAKKEYLLAAESYRAFAKLYPTHSKLSYVYYRAGLAYLKESPKAIDRDQEYLDDALGYLEIGLRYFPGSPYEEETRQAYDEVMRRMGRRNLYVGKFYYKRKEYLAALPRFATVADEYQNLGIDAEALYLLAKSYLKLDQRSKAFEVTAILKQRHPDSKYLKKLMGELDI